VGHGVIVYDLDGTLIDTHEAVRQAYLVAGVEMPDDAWGKTWQEWLPDFQKHNLKNLAYPEMLRKYAKPLPLYYDAIKSRDAVLTGASREAVYAIKKIFPGLRIAMMRATRKRKLAWLRRQRVSISKPGIYVDDDEITRELVRKELPWWVTLSPEEFLVSSWRRVPTRDLTASSHPG